MEIAAKAQSHGPVMVEGLQAGFLIYSESRSDKDFALFEVTENGIATYSRICTKDEKKKLRKMVYGQRVVKSITPKELLKSKDSCLLFVYC